MQGDRLLDDDDDNDDDDDDNDDDDDDDDGDDERFHAFRVTVSPIGKTPGTSSRKSFSLSSYLERRVGGGGRLISISIYILI